MWSLSHSAPAQETLVQLEQSRPAVGQLLDLLNSEPPLNPSSSRPTGGALLLRWKNALRRTKQETRRCRDVQDTRSRWDWNTNTCFCPYSALLSTVSGQAGIIIAWPVWQMFKCLEKKHVSNFFFVFFCYGHKIENVKLKCFLHVRVLKAVKKRLSGLNGFVFFLLFFSNLLLPTWPRLERKLKKCSCIH